MKPIAFARAGNVVYILISDSEVEPSDESRALLASTAQVGDAEIRFAGTDVGLPDIVLVEADGSRDAPAPSKRDVPQKEERDPSADLNKFYEQAKTDAPAAVKAREAVDRDYKDILSKGSGA